MKNLPPMSCRITVESPTMYEPQLAELRIEVFKSYPYLYDGDMDYEMDYLSSFVNSPESIIVIARNQEERVVGASTALPLADEDDDVKQPWIEAGYDVNKIFYYGESVLLPQYKGQGVGKRFFEEREKYVRSLGKYEMLVFCAVIRPDDHPKRPANYCSLEPLWLGQGFSKAEGVTCEMEWKEVDEVESTVKQLQFWYKKL